ncbi:MAG: phosphoribosylamine--glycine ligase [Proteobacteria bacterium]|nr:phosphoribosylamine--glycine ligase [Pseudomonadota bacterium]
MTHVLLIGNGAREHAIAEAVVRSGRNPRLSAFMKTNNPGIASLATEVRIGRYNAPEAVIAFAKETGAEFAVIGPEDPLSHGIVDDLTAAGIPAVGPTRVLARLETSKSFTRNLLEKYGIPGNPRFRNFPSIEGIETFCDELAGIVLKPDGLTGGKGVLVQGDHFQTRTEALEHCRNILKTHPCVTIEEKLEGEEFSLQCLSDGRTVVPTPPVQDHKRRFVGDSGPNTGGMGSYSCADHLLPFLDADAVAEGLAITRKVAEAIRLETGIPYKGVLYGGFMLTRTGVKLIEYNARFGDPEAMNILPLLRTDFIDVCRAIIDGKLDQLDIVFEKKATVCKYIVPKGYGLPEDHPDASSGSSLIVIGDVQTARLYYSSIEQRSDGLYMTPSRAIGVVGIADDLPEAERIAERAVAGIHGPVDHRPDIGTEPLIRKRVQHMKELKAEQI